MTTPGPLERWVMAARLRTLPAAVVPVAIGIAIVTPHHVDVTNGILCLIIALALQIATNYANDYSDGIRGTDATRVGPFRITASGLVPAARVKQMAVIFFALAGLAGLALSVRTSWWFVPLGASAMAAGWFYTGGRHPYGYLGLGEVFVMAYFGFVATIGTAFAQTHHVVTADWWWGLCAGSMACALLEANNLRDVDGDRASGKRTLAARLGRRRGSALYIAAVVGVILGAAMGGEAFVGAVALAAYIPALVTVMSPATGRQLLKLLKQSAQAQLVVGVAAVLVLTLTR